MSNGDDDEAKLGKIFSSSQAAPPTDEERLGKIFNPQPAAATTAAPASPAGAPQAGAQPIVPPETSVEPGAQQSVQGAIYTSPYAKRKATVGAMPLNFARDVGQQAAGIGALGALPFLREYEALPRIPYLHDQPSQPLLRETDLPEAAQAVKGVGDYYMNEYVKPLMKAAADPSDNTDRVLAEHFAKAPLNTMLDLGIPTGAKTGLKMAGQVAEHNNWFRRAVAPGLAAEMSDGAVTKHLSNVINSAEDTRLKKIHDAQTALDVAYQKVDKNYRPYLTSIGEFTDQSMRKLRKDPAIDNFLNVAKQHGDLMKDILGFPTDPSLGPMLGNVEKRAIDDSVLRTEYGPMLLSYLKKQHPNLAFNFADLADPRYMTMLEKLKGRLDKIGARPSYAPVMNQVQFEHAWNNVFSRKLGGIAGRRTVAAAQEVARRFPASLMDLPKNLWPGWLQERAKAFIQDRQMGKGMQPMTGIRGPEHATDMKNLIALQVARTFQYAAVKEIVSEVLKLKAQPGWVPVNLKRLMDSIASQTGGNRITIKELFDQAKMPDGTVYLPPKAAELIQQALGGREQWPNLMHKLENVNRGARTAAYTLDPGLGPKLGVANALAFAWSLNTPKQVLEAIVSSALALHPDARKAIPDSILLSHGKRMSPKLLEAGINMEKALDLAGKWGYGPQQWVRRSMALHYFMYVMKNARGKTSNFVADMLNTTAALEELDKRTWSPGALRKMQKQISPYLGDYGEEMWGSPAARLFNLGGLTSKWVGHATGLLSTLPDHPFKTSLLNTLARIEAKALQPRNEPEALKKQGMIPMKDAQGRPLRGASGKREYFGGPGIDLESGGLGVLGAAAGLLFDSDVSQSRLPTRASPLISIPLGAMGYDIDRNKMYIDENPDVYRKYNKYYDSKTHQPLTKEQLSKAWRPPLWAIAGDKMFYKQWKQLQQGLTFHGHHFHAASPFVYPGNAVRNRTGQVIRQPGEIRGKGGYLIRKSPMEVLLDMGGVRAREG
jgi:hypothetical protein